MKCPIYFILKLDKLDLFHPIRTGPNWTKTVQLGTLEDYESFILPLTWGRKVLYFEHDENNNKQTL